MCTAFLREQRFDLVAQGVIACTRLVEKRVAFAMRAVQPSMKELLDALPPTWVHLGTV